MENHQFCFKINTMEFIKKLTILDKFILKQIAEVFILGIIVFTSIIFASDTFISLIKQISMYGMPFKIAFMIILLNKYLSLECP